MELFSIIGRFLFAGFFIFSGYKSIKELLTDDLVRKEFTSMMVGILNFREFTPEELAYIEMSWVHILVTFCASFKGIGGFLILFDYVAGTIHLIIYLLITTSVRCVYYYKVGEPEFIVFFQGFMQNMTLFGAILLYIEMKITIGRRQSKKKIPKSKKT